MYKKIILIILFLLSFNSLFLCQSVLAEESKSNFILPETTREEPKNSLEKLQKEVAYLSKYIGSYPPGVSSQENKQKIYNRWSEAFIDINAHLKNDGKSEEILSILSELLREGHNLDVQGTGYLAKETINLCLNEYTESVNCNFSAMRFYLSIEPTRENLAKVKKSTDFLAFVYSPDLPPEVVDAIAYLDSNPLKNKTVFKKALPTPVAKVVSKTTKKKIIVSTKTKSRK